MTTENETIENRLHILWGLFAGMAAGDKETVELINETMLSVLKELAWRKELILEYSEKIEKLEEEIKQL